MIQFKKSLNNKNMNLDSMANYDPTDANFENVEMYDPQGGIIGEKFGKKRGYFKSKNVAESGKITFKIKNLTSIVQRAELFNPLRSIVNYPNPSKYLFNGGSKNWEPLPTKVAGGFVLGFSRFAQAVSDKSDLLLGDGVATYTQAGSLAYVGGTNKIKWGGAVYSDNINFDYLDERSGVNVQSDILVTCQQLPYASLQEDLKSTVLEASQMKIQFSSEAQIGNAIEMVRYKTLGSSVDNSLEPSSYANPINQQSKLIEINQTILIDSQTAWFFTLEPNEEISINMSITAYKNNSLETM